MAFIVCFAVLAVLAQAHGYAIGCGDDTTQTIRIASAPAVVPTFSVGSLPSFDLSGSSAAQSTERVDRTTYTVALDNSGPSSVNCPPVIRSQKQAPVVQRPTITLPARIPGPRTLCNQCKCVKTIVKPQVYEQLITVPIVQRYIQTSHRPVVEKIHYQAVPANANDNVECSSSSSDYTPVQTAAVVAVEAPRVEAQSFVPVQVASEPQFEAPCFEQTPVQTVSFPSCY